MSFDAFNIVRGLHILAVIAWMAGMLFLPRLFAYDAEQQGKAEPLKSEMQSLLRVWQGRLLKIIINPAMTAAWVFGVWMILIHVYGYGEGWAFLARPWMATKLLAVVALSGWHGFLSGELRKIQAGTSIRTSRFWRMTNEIPFLIAIVAVLSVTTEWTFG
ncbi:putative membrane protein [Brevundimonas alba]|uniref:Protoporphyrinogen IX oxidase n=1 Tax=Brevundimonas alba TaxID=74314 RepID=A0A7X5YIT0_9CAUL|nr:CopD family protein [Brevundimonas alba]NJC40728.1 putative membrane protein [Brevundimonas alba]